MKKTIMTMLLLLVCFTILSIGLVEVEAADEKRVRYFETVEDAFDTGKDGSFQNVVWGYKDGKGKVVIPAEYSSVMPFSEGRAYVYDDAAKGWKLIDTKGNQVTDTIYSATPTPFYQGVSIVGIMNDELSTEYFLINKSGERITEKSYGSISLDVYNNYTVKKNGKTGVIDKNGKTVIAMKEKRFSCIANVYAFYYDLSDGRVAYQYYAQNGKKLGSKTVLFATALGDNVLISQEGKKTIYNAKSGKKIKKLDASVETIYSSRYQHSEQTKIFVYSNSEGKQGLCDKNGKIILKAKYDSISTSHDKYSTGYMRNASKGSTNILNQKGKCVAKFEKGNVEPLPGNLFIVISTDSSYKSHYSIVDANKKTIVKKDTYDKISYDYPYDSGTNQTYHFITVTKNGKTGVLNMKGKVIIKPEFDSVIWDDGYFIVKKDNKQGLYTFDGKKILDTEYTYIYQNVSGVYASSVTSYIHAIKDSSTHEYYEADGTLIGKSSATINSNIY